MPIDNWGTPGRDTFELNAHEHFLSFLHSNEEPFSSPYQPIQRKLTRNVQPQRIRTWKKLFEKMGILHVRNKTLFLTDFGIVLQDQLSKPGAQSPENNPTIAEAALKVLAQYQLLNPTSQLSFPDNCDVFPYWTLWKAMRSLDNKLHWEELNRVVLRIMKMSQLEAAVEKIRQARKLSGYPERFSDADFTRALGEKIDLPQRSRAMSAIFSEAGFGGCLIERKQRPDHFRYLNLTHLPLLDEVLKKVPAFHRDSTDEQWFSHYGKLAEAPFKPLTEAVKKQVLVYPRELIETVAEAYLIHGKSHREIQEDLLKKPAPAHGGGFKAMAILHYLGLDESAKALFRNLPTAPEADLLLKEKTPWLTPVQRHELIAILESYKASRQTEGSIPQGYFSAETEIESTSTRRVRKQQDKLREFLLKLYSNKCAICDIDDPVLLRAGHIVPWAVDKQNRLNPANAILLCILHDLLFEEGFISFNDDLGLLISKELRNSKSLFLKKALELLTPFRIPKSYRPDKQFLEFHRSKIFAQRDSGKFTYPMESVSPVGYVKEPS